MENNLVKIGDLGIYEIDGDSCFGMYIRLSDLPVFIDIKEDKNQNIRIKQSQMLLKLSEQLEKEIFSLKSTNEKYKNSNVSSIGLHSNDENRAEIFWDSGHCCLLNLGNLSFYEL